ncbi:MAG TPA: N(G),N(G)-dimethylarginine dimethylaminohydrolase [Thermoanaerobaculia bacterium]|nr:N(G),N(G)-dimethylarginine dimethylaminohydrolase [Thermoanaerobaculia bacterium]
MYRRAIVRRPAENFADGLTTQDLGVPDVARALEQHAAYAAALERCGLMVTRLSPDPRYPDSTFVEDTAILTPRGAVLTRPGAPPRAGEVGAIEPAIRCFYPGLPRIEAPGTVDGGDVCEAGDHFFIGISERTNADGARQLAGHLARLGYTSSEIDVRGVAGILHLKSGIAALDARRLVLIRALAAHPAFAGFERLVVEDAEAYAANCVRVNDHLLVASGYPRFEAAARKTGLDAIALDMSEFAKMDGGLSCLSLRFWSS